VNEPQETEPQETEPRSPELHEAELREAEHHDRRGAEAPVPASPAAAASPASQLTRRSGIVAAGTMLSRVLGVARDQVLAATIPTAWTDLFFDAFTIPNALRGLLAEGAVSSALVPVYSEVREREGTEAAKRFYAGFRGAMLVVLLAVSAIGVLCARPIATAYGAGFADDPERFEAFVTLTRIVFPYILFMGLAALGAGVLNAHGHFAVPAAAPALLNVSFVLAPFVLVPPLLASGQPAIFALGIAALVGGVLQVVAQWPALRAVGMPSLPRLDLSDTQVRKAFRLLLPLTLGLGVYQLNVMMSRLFTSYLPEGAMSYLYYAQRLVEIPQGMFGVAIASAAMPTLAALRAKGDREGMLATFREALSLAMFVAFPLSAVLAALGHPIVVVLFSRGEFGADAALETGRSLAWQAAGVWAVASVRVLVPVFHAHNETRLPLWGGAANLVVFVASGFFLSRALGHVGIAIAISLAGTVQCLVLGALLRRKLGALGLRSMLPALARSALASLLAGAAGWGVARLGAWERGGNDPSNLAVLSLALLVSALVFLGLGAALGAPELARLTARLRRRLRRG
jgi:putative peptidoglycan lipid II flippase